MEKSLSSFPSGLKSIMRIKKGFDFIRDESPEQTNQNYGNLYFHSTNRKDPSKLYHWSRNRVGLCLSEQNDVCFSLLLKRALVKDQERKENQVIDSTKFMYQKESQLANKIRNLFGPMAMYVKWKSGRVKKTFLLLKKSESISQRKSIQKIFGGGYGYHG